MLSVSEFRTKLTDEIRKGLDEKSVWSKPLSDRSFSIVFDSENIGLGEIQDVVTPSKPPKEEPKKVIKI